MLSVIIPDGYPESIPVFLVNIAAALPTVSLFNHWNSLKMFTCYMMVVLLVLI